MPKNAAYMGFEKEPPSRFGPKETGRPLVHSHSKMPKRAVKIHGKKRSHKHGG